MLSVCWLYIGITLREQKVTTGEKKLTGCYRLLQVTADNYMLLLITNGYYMLPYLYTD